MIWINFNESNEPGGAFRLFARAGAGIWIIAGYPARYPRAEQLISARKSFGNKETASE
jgi:hypothetical protein